MPNTIWIKKRKFPWNPRKGHTPSSKLLVKPISDCAPSRFELNIIRSHGLVLRLATSLNTFVFPTFSNKYKTIYLLNFQPWRTGKKCYKNSWNGLKDRTRLRTVGGRFQLMYNVHWKWRIQVETNTEGQKKPSTYGMKQVQVKRKKRRRLAHAFSSPFPVATLRKQLKSLLHGYSCD